MSCYLSHVAVVSVVASLALTICAGCPKTPRRILPPNINAADAGKKAIEQYDANKDGKISGDELAKCPALNDLAGKNKGEVTAENITDVIKSWQSTKTGRFPYSCVVLHNGKPLDGAAVTLVPEKFLGIDSKSWSGSGKSDKSGTVELSIPVATPEEATGIPFGFYRVEITKEGENIPAKYNTETTLGVMANGPTVAGKTTFKLVY